ncbi:MAG TPA: hypothetical protein VF477_02005 [Mycobacterium sp.]
MTRHTLSVADPCGPLASSQAPHWLQLVQAIGAVATTIGVLTALYVVIVREPREASQLHQNHVAQLNELRRAKTDRAAAQARKLLPSTVRTPIFGDLWWTVRIDNTSHSPVTILAVDVTAVDADGRDIPGGCRRTNNAMPADAVIDRSIRAVLSSHPDSEVIPTLGQAIRDGMAGHFVDEWPPKLQPYQHALMTYVVNDPDHELRVTVDYEDEAGYQWRRSDTGKPRRTDEVALISIPETADQPWLPWEALQ